MTKVATYDDLLAEIEAQKAYIEQLEAKLEEPMPFKAPNQDGRIPLMGGWYALAGKKALAWVPTAAEADKLFDIPGVEEVSQMRLFPVKTGRKPGIEDFERLREAYYATTTQP